MPFHIIKTMKKYENSQSMEAFLFSPRKFAIQTWLYNCPQYLCLFYIVFECIPRKHDQGKMLVLPNRLLCLSNFHIRSRFCFFPANFMSSTYTDLFHDVQRYIPYLETFSQPCCNRNFFSHNSPAKR